MPKIMTHRMALALKDGAPRFLMAAIDHPDGMFRCWTGIGTLDYGGEEWTGIGTLGQIAPIKRTTQIAVQEVTFTLLGVNQEALALLSGKIRNRIGKVWLACLTANGTVVRDPYQLINAQLDYQKYQVSDDGEAAISLIGRSGAYTLERAVNDVWSDDDQQRRFPGDTGLKYLATLQNQQVIWKKS